MDARLILKEIGSRINNIGTIVDTDPNNDAGAASDKNIKDIDKTSNTADIIEKAYKGLDDIIYRYNQKGQSLGEDDKLRAGVTAQSMQGSILESNVFTDPESGYLKIDTAQQTLANAAAIKVLFEKIDELEKLIKK